MVINYQTKRMDATPKKKNNWFCYNSCYYKSSNSSENDGNEQKKIQEFMAKYMANYRAHRKSMSPEEVSQYYTQWSENLQYEKDMEPGIYNGPTIIAEEVAECYPVHREHIRIIDIACGTGRVGEELVHYGFKCIDGLDPSSGMLKQCRKKNIYKNLYQEYCSDNTISIEESLYDCLVVSGGMGEGHIPCSGLLEMIRIVKPGGLILIVMRKEYLKYVEEYVDRLEPLMAKLEQENKWTLLKRREVNNYSFDRDGVLFRFRVKKGM